MNITSIKSNGAQVSINGKVYSGNSVTIKDGNVVVDGKSQGKVEEREITIVVNGDVEYLDSSAGDVTVNGDAGRISVNSGNVDCDDVRGSVTVSCGNVNCDDVGGDVSASCGNILRK